MGEGGFTGAIGAEQTEKFTGLDIERHLIQCGERATCIGKCFGDRLEGDSSHGKLAILSLAFCTRPGRAIKWRRRGPQVIQTTLPDRRPAPIAGRGRASR